jgi:cysteinyl-tRNA synthetase
MNQELSLYNTLTRQKEEFKPVDANNVRMYACGPTVYNYAHIGNMRTYVFEDVLRRALKHAGYNLQHVMNITDVGHLQSDADEGDDKMSLAAQREKKSPWDIARFYENEFFRHAALLNIQRPDVVCRATDHVQEMIEMVKTLVEKGYAYISQGNVYFDVTKFDRYAEFAKLRMDEQSQTDRVEHDERKRNQADFALWFSQSKFPNQIMKWDSPWGVGFPGWHIECSAMASKYLGKHFDIHCGGIDHINVHHTNEIAQSECCHGGHKWVNYWLHGEFLNVDSGKMSKSKGQFLTVDTLVQDGFDPMAYRYLLLTAHYRSELKFSYEALSSAHSTLQGLRERVLEWKKNALSGEVVGAAAKEFQEKFWAAVNDDLHMPIALSVVWAAAKSDSLSDAEKLGLIQDFDTVLGLGLMAYQKREVVLTDEQAAMIAARDEAKKSRNFAESDRIRDELKAMGIALEDTPQGTTWRYVG